MINMHFRAMLALAACLWLSAAPASEAFKSGGPYVPTPQVVVDRMLQFAGVNEKDFVVDLGSGDGVIVLTAARQYKAGGMGVDIDPDLVKLSNDRARQQKVADRVGFIEQDVFKADLSRATVVTLYLLPGMMLDLRPKIFNELKPGVRVVSHDYHFGEWYPDDRITFDVPEKEKINGVPKATISLWYVPAKVAGRWQVRLAGGETYELVLKQRFQQVDGEVIVGGKPVRPQLLGIQGDEIRFNLPDARGGVRFSGRVRDNAMGGTAEIPGAAKPAPWTATRVAQARVITE
jgi:hypothetical protein